MNYNNLQIQANLEAKYQEARQGVGSGKIDIQHSKGKLTARERIEVLLDHQSFEEVGIFVKHRCNNFDMSSKMFLGDGVITGHGTINGRLVFYIAKILLFLAVH